MPFSKMYIFGAWYGIFLIREKPALRAGLIISDFEGFDRKFSVPTLICFPHNNTLVSFKPNFTWATSIKINNVSCFQGNKLTSNAFINMFLLMFWHVPMFICALDFMWAIISPLNFLKLLHHKLFLVN